MHSAGDSALLQLDRWVPHQDIAWGRRCELKCKTLQLIVPFSSSSHIIFSYRCSRHLLKESVMGTTLLRHWKPVIYEGIGASLDLLIYSHELVKGDATLLWQSSLLLNIWLQSLLSLEPTAFSLPLSLSPSSKAHCMSACICACDVKVNQQVFH